MIEERPELDQHVVQTSKLFRDVGYTINAIRYPLSDAAVAWLCQFNGAPVGWTPPMAWRYAPNEACKAMLERNAAATGTKPDGIPLTAHSMTASSERGPSRISAALGSRPQQTMPIVIIHQISWPPLNWTAWRESNSH